MKKIEINDKEYNIEMNLAVPMTYEEISGNAWITQKKMTQRNIYQLIYSVLKANNDFFSEDFNHFVRTTLTNNSWIIKEISDLIFSNEQVEEVEKKS